jgi:hypothetical protein
MLVGLGLYLEALVIGNGLGVGACLRVAHLPNAVGVFFHFIETGVR